MSVKKTDNIIDLSESLNLLNKIRDIKKGEISSKEFSSSYEIQLQPNNKGITYTFISDTYNFGQNKWRFRDLELYSSGLKLNIPIIYITGKVNEVIEGKIPSFEYGLFEKEKSAYHRLLLPLNKDLNFTFSVENVILYYKYITSAHTSQATEIKINDHIFHLFSVKKKLTDLSHRDYLVIESKAYMPYREFSELCYSILISFGYVSGDFINNDGYFLQYDCNEMNTIKGIAYRQMRGSVKCQYVPIYSNPFGYLHDTKKAALYKDTVRKLNLKEFSRLCQYCHENEDIKTVLLLLIEVNNQSLVSGPAVLSIALETLANILYEKNQDSLAPIKNKSLSRKIRKELLKTLDNFKIDAEGKEIIMRKINQINQTTNRDKLLIPFKILEIPITPADEKAIEKRNEFLHGRSPMIKETENETQNVRYYLFLKLYVLISSIILKYIGYDNLVLNFPKIYERYTGIELDEEFYKQI